MAGLVVDQPRVRRDLRLELVGCQHVEDRELAAGAGQVTQRIEIAGIHEVADQQHRSSPADPTRVVARGRRQPGQALGPWLGEEPEQLERASLAAHRPHPGRGPVTKERDADAIHARQSEVAEGGGRPASGIELVRLPVVH